MIRIYALSDPTTGELRYVGKTALTLEERLKSHTWGSTLKHGNYRTHWLKSLDRLPIIELIEEVAEDLADETETFWIGQFKALGFRLVNHQDGGKGWPKGQKRRPKTDEEKARHSAGNKGRKKAPRNLEHTLANAAAQTRAFTDQNGNLYSSPLQAEFKLGIKKASVSAVLCGRRNSVYGYKFRYLEET